MSKEKQITAAVETAAKKLKSLGAGFHIVAVARDETDPGGGIVVEERDLKGEDFIISLKLGLTDREDLIDMANFVTKILIERKLTSKVKINGNKKQNR